MLGRHWKTKTQVCGFLLTCLQVWSESPFFRTKITRENIPKSIIFAQKQRLKNIGQNFYHLLVAMLFKNIVPKLIFLYTTIIDTKVVKTPKTDWKS